MKGRIELTPPGGGPLVFTGTVELPDYIGATQAAEPTTYTEAALCAKWGVSARTIERLRHSRKLAYIEIAARRYVYPAEAVAAFEAERTVEALSPRKRRTA